MAVALADVRRDLLRAEAAIADVRSASLLSLLLTRCLARAAQKATAFFAEAALHEAEKRQLERRVRLLEALTAKSTPTSPIKPK